MEENGTCSKHLEECRNVHSVESDGLYEDTVGTANIKVEVDVELSDNVNQGEDDCKHEIRLESIVALNSAGDIVHEFDKSGECSSK